MRRDDANPPVGDLNQALDELIVDYERDGDFFIRSLAQEERQPLMPPLMAIGRRSHRKWVEGVFADDLARVSSEHREQLAAELIAIMDVYTWKLLRRDMKFSSEKTKGIIQHL